MTLVPPFDDPDVMSGQGTMGLEIVEQLRESGAEPDALLVNCSGGGLASGVITAVKHAFPDTRCYTVEPAGFDKMARSLKAGAPQKNERLTGSIMDALMAPAPGKLTLATLRANGAEGVSATDEEALDAMAAAFRTLKLVVEPGGAAALGALLAGKVGLSGQDRGGRLLGRQCRSGDVRPRARAPARIARPRRVAHDPFGLKQRLKAGRVHSPLRGGPTRPERPSGVGGAGEHGGCKPGIVGAPRTCPDV